MMNERVYALLVDKLMERGEVTYEDLPKFRKGMQDLDIALEDLYLKKGQFSEYVRLGRMSLIDSRFEMTDKLTQMGLFYFKD
jgi:hypothetical protein